MVALTSKSRPSGSSRPGGWCRRIASRRNNGYELSVDPDRLDVELVHRWLSTEAFWALGRTRETVEESMRGSLNFAIYDDSGDQAAYARVVTDRATFAWLCDVYVAPSHRGKGLGTWLAAAAGDRRHHGAQAGRLAIPPPSARPPPDTAKSQKPPSNNPAHAARQVPARHRRELIPAQARLVPCSWCARSATPGWSSHPRGCAPRRDDRPRPRIPLPVSTLFSYNYGKRTCSAERS